MSTSDSITPKTSDSFSTPPVGSTIPQEDATLRELLKRCSPATYQAAQTFRQTGTSEALPTLVQGVIERFVEPDLRPRLKYSSDTLRLSEDLGLDSLTMMEIVLLTEEVLHISIDADELRQLRTLGQVKQFVECKVRGVPANLSTMIALS